MKSQNLQRVIFVQNIIPHLKKVIVPFWRFDVTVVDKNDIWSLPLFREHLAKIKLVSQRKFLPKIGFFLKNFVKIPQ
jgi:hypothetical protein